MEPPFVIALESHPRGATLYLAGAITAAGVARVIATCDALPPHVCVLRVCARALAPSDPHAVGALAAALRRWACARRARSQACPRGVADGRDAFVAEPCAHRDARERIYRRAERVFRRAPPRRPAPAGASATPTSERS